MAKVVVASCACPECSEPGTSFCGSCGLVKYCSRTCQSIDWSQHKEECQGHLRKVGMAHFEKALGFDRANNWVQSLRSSELALTQLKKLHPRPLELIDIIDGAMTFKYNALNLMNRQKEALECAQERYSLWAAGYMRNSGMLYAAFALIDSLLNNHEYEQAALIAATAHEMVTCDTDNIIPEENRRTFIALATRYLAQATYHLAQTGGIAPEKKQKTGEETIALARKALEIDTQMHGDESLDVAMDIVILADAVKYFNGVDNDEALRLYEQAIAIHSREEGRLSQNVANSKHSLGVLYHRRANGARKANDLDRCKANLELALPHYREAARIFTVINNADNADSNTKLVARMEEELRQIRIHIVNRAFSRG